MLTPGDQATIQYGLTCDDDTSFNFNNDAWYGGMTSGNTMRPVFGYDTTQIVQLSFIPSTALSAEYYLLKHYLIISDNYPNPFNPATTFDIELHRRCAVYIDI